MGMSVCEAVHYHPLYIILNIYIYMCVLYVLYVLYVYGHYQPMVQFMRFLLGIMMTWDVGFPSHICGRGPWKILPSLFLIFKHHIPSGRGYLYLIT